MSQVQRVEQYISAGGLVYRLKGDSVEVVICGRSSPYVWGLPKGTPDPGETRKQTALREVNEETGLQVKIEAYIDSIHYWFIRSPAWVRCNKTVLYYLMAATGGDVSLHDHEFDTVIWVPAKEAVQKLTYENEVRIVQKGLSMVSKEACIG